MALQVLLDQGALQADSVDQAEVARTLEDFFAQRVRYVLQEDGVAYDVVDAITAAGPYPYGNIWKDAGGPHRLRTQARALSACRAADSFVVYLNAYTRCVNLSKKEKITEDEEIRWERLTDPAEALLQNRLEQVEGETKKLAQAGAYHEAYTAAARLVEPINGLFEAVMIMDQDPDIKKARLALLRRCVAALGCLGDLTLLVQ